MKHSWLWFGPDDPISLRDIEQTGVDELVTALFEKKQGTVWSKDEIRERKQTIEWDEEHNRPRDLRWSIVESLPIHRDIKARTGDVQKRIDQVKQTLQNLGACGLDTVVFDFMPVMGWTRTRLNDPNPDGSIPLRYHHADTAAFDLFLLNREGAEDDYCSDVLEKAKERFENLSDEGKSTLKQTILSGLPGAEGSYTLDEFRAQLERFQTMSVKQYRNHLRQFLEEIVPVAESCGISLAMHPDDPPWSVFGVPRVLSTQDDLTTLMEMLDSPANGWTCCVGSYGARPDNNIVEMIREHGDRLRFLHLRNVRRQSPRSFVETHPFEGDVPMVQVVRRALQEEQKRMDSSGEPVNVPMRPDHGLRLHEDLEMNTRPGYSLAGRTRALSELRGLERGIRVSPSVEGPNE